MTNCVLSLDFDESRNAQIQKDLPEGVQFW